MANTNIGYSWANAEVAYDLMARRLAGEGFFAVNIERNFAKDLLVTKASFLCDTVGFIEVRLEVKLYTPYTEVHDAMLRARADYFKWRKLWEEASECT